MKKVREVNSCLETKRISIYQMSSIWLLQNKVFLFFIKGMLTKDDFKIYKYGNKMTKEGFILNIQVNSDQTFVLLGF